MKKCLILLIGFAVSCLTANAQTKVDTLTNEKVIKLSKLGLEPSVLIAKIQSSVVAFWHSFSNDKVFDFGILNGQK